MLIGQALRLSFAGYLWDAGVPSLVGLAAVWWVIRRGVRGQWKLSTALPPVQAPSFNAWQTTKGFMVLTVLMILFLASPWPREVLALAAAGWLLLSRRMASRDMLALVDWQLLALFSGLFIVNHSLASSGSLARINEAMRSAGVDASRPAWLFGITVVLSNLVSNVPAVMLLLPSATHPFAGPILALSSTLAGNLLIVGSIANIIVVDQAARLGLRITWREHARAGVPRHASDACDLSRVALGANGLRRCWMKSQPGRRRAAP